MDKYLILKKYFGYDSFRPLQEATIDSILSGNDTIVLLATGGGKSLIFQIPALLNEGITIVITPLISLMVDQVEALKKRGIAAEYLNSLRDYFEVEVIYKKIENKQIKLLYLSPEKLQNENFLKTIVKTKIAIICLDESHSVEERYSFRPAYGKIGAFIDKLAKKPTIVAVTATATNSTLNDISTICKMNNPKIFRSTFDRPNLYYGVIKTKDKLAYLEFYLTRHPYRGIIYASTRRTVEFLYSYLKVKGYAVIYYHGGLDNEKKKKHQDIYAKGTKYIMIATISFGLGIDLPNIRYIILYDIPSSLEDLVQMFGRCSRDGKYGEGIVLYDKSGIETNLHYIYTLKNDNMTNKLYLEERANRKNKLNSVVDFCTTSKCLHNKILKYFEEKIQSRCNNCSNCQKR